MRAFTLFNIAASALGISLASCSTAEDLLDGLNKAESTSYLRNESGQDVTVVFRPCRHATLESCTWFVPKDSVVEIYDTEQWGLQQHINRSDTVFFRFADGTEVLHYYIDDHYPNHDIRFVPATNNIFSIGLDVPDDAESWIKTKLPHNKCHNEYVIKLF